MDTDKIKQLEETMLYTNMALRAVKMIAEQIKDESLPESGTLAFLEEDGIIVKISKKNVEHE
jgi:hypothetical protein